MDDLLFELNESKGRAFAQVNGRVLAEMTFSIASPELYIIDHTEVNDELRGQGIGRQMLNKIVAYARQNNIKLIPLCPYAKAVFQKDSSIHDVLK